MHTSTHLDIEQFVKNQGFANAHEFAKIRLTAWLKRRVADSFFHSQQTQFQRLLDALQPEIKQPFNDFPEKRLQDYTREQWQKVEVVLTAFDYDLETYVVQEFTLYCREQLDKSVMLIRYYTQKYGTDWETACARFHSYDFDVIEKEEDLQLWEEALIDTEGYSEDLNALLQWTP